MSLEAFGDTDGAGDWSDEDVSDYYDNDELPAWALDDDPNELPSNDPNIPTPQPEQEG